MTEALRHNRCGLLMMEPTSGWLARRAEFVKSGAAQVGYADGLKRMEMARSMRDAASSPVALAGGNSFAEYLLNNEDFTGPKFTMEGPVAVVDLDGPIFANPDWIDVLMGGVSGWLVEQAILEAGSSVDSTVVCLRMTCEGGSASCADGIVAAIRRVQDSGKPVVCLTENYCYSLGMFPACAGDEHVMTKGAQAGSIGSIIPMYDDSRAFEDAGLKPTPSASPEGKARVMAGMPVTKEELAMNQRLVDLAMADFAAFVSQSTGLTVAEVMGLNAAYFAGPDAVKNKLADRIVTSGEAYLAELANKYPRQAAGSRGKNNQGGVAHQGGDAQKGPKMTEDQIAKMKEDAKAEARAEARAEALAAAKAPASFKELHEAFGKKEGGMAFVATCQAQGLTLVAAHAAWADQAEASSKEAAKKVEEAEKKAEAAGKKTPGVPYRPGAHAGNGGSGGAATGKEETDPCEEMGFVETIRHIQKTEKVSVERAQQIASQRYPEKRNEYADQVKVNSESSPTPPRGEFKRD